MAKKVIVKKVTVKGKEKKPAKEFVPFRAKKTAKKGKK
jgi:hypothetical protein